MSTSKKCRQARCNKNNCFLTLLLSLTSWLSKLNIKQLGLYCLCLSVVYYKARFVVIVQLCVYSFFFLSCVLSLLFLMEYILACLDIVTADGFQCKMIVFHQHNS